MWVSVDSCLLSDSLDLFRGDRMPSSPASLFFLAFILSPIPLSADPAATMVVALRDGLDCSCPSALWVCVCGCMCEWMAVGVCVCVCVCVCVLARVSWFSSCEDGVRSLPTPVVLHVTALTGCSDPSPLRLL